MANFFISILTFSVSVFLLGVSLRYGLKGAGNLDEYFLSKSNKNFSGFNWYYRIPFSIGLIPEYYFYIVIGRENYFKTNWWAIKTSAFLSVLLALALLNNRTMVYDYYTFKLVIDHGFLSLFTSGSLIWYLNIISVLYLALLTIIVVESVKMHGIFSPIRIFIYSLLSFFMASLTIIVLGLIVFITAIYIAFKVIKFLFFSNKKSYSRNDEEEEVTGIFRKGLSSFKPEVLEWEQELKTRRSEKREKVKPKITITRKKKTSEKIYKSDIPRLHPD